MIILNMKKLKLSGSNYRVDKDTHLLSPGSYLSSHFNDPMEKEDVLNASGQSKPSTVSGSQLHPRLGFQEGGSSFYLPATLC